MRTGKRRADYDARAQQIFETNKRTTFKQLAAQEAELVSGAETNGKVRPSCDGVAGDRFLLSAEAVVHGLLNLPVIRDPERWLKRHGAPVALHTGQYRRYLAADILGWAADKFAPTAASRAALLSIAQELQRSTDVGTRDESA
jgi:hypothetical protein